MATPEEVLYQKTCVELRAELKKKGLKVAGRKAELVKRLSDFGLQEVAEKENTPIKRQPIQHFPSLLTSTLRKKLRKAKSSLPSTPTRKSVRLAKRSESALVSTPKRKLRMKRRASKSTKKRSKARPLEPR